MLIAGLIDRDTQTFDLVTKSPKLSGTRQAIVCGLRTNEPRCKKAGEDSEETDARAHENHGDEAPFGRSGKSVTVPHCGNRREGPPDCIFRRLYVRLGYRLEVQNRDTAEDDEEERYQARGQEGALDTAPDDQRGKEFRGSQAPQNSKDAHQSRHTTPPSDVDHRDRRQKVKPSPCYE